MAEVIKIRQSKLTGQRYSIQKHLLYSRTSGESFLVNRILLNNSINFLFSRKGLSSFSPHNESVFITNQQGLPKMTTSPEMKTHWLKKLPVLKTELILQQEVKLKVAVSIFQVWKNIICFLLLVASIMSKGWGERPTYYKSVYRLICSREKSYTAHWTELNWTTLFTRVTSSKLVTRSLVTGETRANLDTDAP